MMAGIPSPAQARSSMRTPPLDRAARSQALRRKSSGRPLDAGIFVGHLPAGDPPDTVEVASVGPSAALLALLDVQEVDAEGRAGRRRAAVCRGDALLKRLEGLRTEILGGRIAPQRLQALAQALREERMVSDDADIEEVLAEIELRVEVEIAKLTTAGQPSGGS